MNVPTCTRRILFCAGHRVMNHESKCANLHGHQYELFVTAKAVRLDSIGRVIDFSVLKQVIGGWIDEHWDHGTILSEDDHQWIAAFVAARSKLFILPHNPTAENMAYYLLNFFGPRMMSDYGVQIVKIKLYETENCYAEVTA